MMAASEWHKYQENYVKYGVELEAERLRRKKKVKTKPQLKVSAREKVIILMAIMVIGACCILAIFLQAFASNVNYSIYTLNQKIDVLSGDIDNLQVDLNMCNSLGDIEYYAINDLMMVYPEGTQCVYVSEYEGTPEVENYIAELTQSQRGITKESDATVSIAAKHLFAQA